MSGADKEKAKEQFKQDAIRLITDAGHEGMREDHLNKIHDWIHNARIDRTLLDL